MLDQNTDRMWYLIGAIVIGAVVIGVAAALFRDQISKVANNIKNTIDTQLGGASIPTAP